MMLNTLVLFLLLCPQFASALFDSQSALPQIFHNWLHFASNFHSPHNAPPAPHPRDANVPLAVPPPPLPSYVLGAATSNATLTFEITYHRQIMHRSEIDLIASYLRRNDIYLEFGSGASTFNFAPLVSRAYSIEHNCDWLNRMPSNIPQRAANYSNLHLKCIPILPGTRGWGTLSPFEHANYFQFRRYVDAVDSLAEPKFDKVLIDGRARIACALKILPYLHSDSLVFIHDFYAHTSHYSPILHYYEEVGRILAYANTDASQGPIDEPQGLVVLRRHPNATFPLSTSVIDALYNRVDWRHPFDDPLISLPARVRYAYRLAFDFGNWTRARNPHALVLLVRHDLLRMALLYAIVMLIIRNWPLFKRRRKTTMTSHVPNVPSVVVDGRRRLHVRSASLGQQSPSCTEIRFIETDAMKAASARRKRTTPNSNSPL